jgi:hypothetical protein
LVGTVVPEIVQQEIRVKVIRRAETERPAQVHAGPLDRWFRFDDPFDGSD